MSPATTIVVYSLLIVAASIAGGWLPSLLRLTHTRVQLMMSAVGGLMLGIGIFHLLPHAVNPQVSLDRAIWWLMAGLLTTFFLIRAFHAHSHGPVEPGDALTAHGEDGDDEDDGDHRCGHGHVHHHHHHESGVGGAHSWIGIFVGLSLHTLLDGAALGAAVVHDFDHSPGMPLYGVAVFLGVLLHKPLDSLSITSMMAGAGRSFRTQQLVNVGYATMCPIGAALFYFGVRESPQQDVVVGCALAFAAGIFICIALADLLPELEFHAHDRVKLSVALLLGVSLAYGIGYLEPGGMHSHDHGAHDHGAHDHSDHSGHDHSREESGHDHQGHRH